MLLLRIFLLCSLLVIHVRVMAQAIDNMSSFRIIDAEMYVRVHYENDFFANTDYYFTQGINVEMVKPSLRTFPLSKLLLTPDTGTNQFGISLEHNAYTPTSIGHDEILYGDRPFAAALLLKTFAMSAMGASRYRITSSFSLGVIGPAAGGYEIQKTIHRWTRGKEPQGWQNQIANDVIINYDVGMEKNILHVNKSFLVNAFADARLGTLNAKLSSGLVIMGGRFNQAIKAVFIGNESPSAGIEKFTFHFYFQPMINLVGYDATMQGGVFNRDSPYTLSAKEVKTITVQTNFGLVAQVHSLYLEYFHTILSTEFEGGLQHKWGGIRIGLKI